MRCETCLLELKKRTCELVVIISTVGMGDIAKINFLRNYKNQEIRDKCCKTFCIFCHFFKFCYFSL